MEGRGEGGAQAGGVCGHQHCWVSGTGGGVPAGREVSAGEEVVCACHHPRTWVMQTARARAMLADTPAEMTTARPRASRLRRRSGSSSAREGGVVCVWGWGGVGGEEVQGSGAHGVGAWMGAGMGEWEERDQVPVLEGGT